DRRRGQARTTGVRGRIPRPHEPLPPPRSARRCARAATRLDLTGPTQAPRRGGGRLQRRPCGAGSRQAGSGQAGSGQAGSGSSGPPVTIGDLTKLLTTGPDEPPVCAVPGPEAAYGDRSATLVTVRIDPGRKQIDLAPGSPAEGLRGNRRFQL